MTKKLSKFLENSSSSHEGVEIPSDTKDYNSENQDVSFDFSKVFKALQTSTGDQKRFGKEPNADSSDEDETIGKLKPCETHTDVKIQSYMDSMDQELSQAGLGTEFSRGTTVDPTPGDSRRDSKKTPGFSGRKPGFSGSGGSKEEDEFKPVNVDLNLVSHLLQSYSSQAGMPGPTSSLLGSLGIKLPDNSDLDRPSNLKPEPRKKQKK